MSRKVIAVAALALLVAGGAVAAARLTGGESGGEQGEPKQAREHVREQPHRAARQAPQQAALRRLVVASSHRPPRNVAMVVFDELPLTSLLGPGEAVDAARYPAFARLSGEALWFRGATAVHDSTALAVPAILDGHYPRPGLGSDYASHPRNLFTLLAPRYDLHVSEEATGLCPPSLCEPTPGSTLSHIGHGRVERFEAWLGAIGRHPGRALFFKHALFPHVPWQYLPSGLSYRRQPSEPTPGLN